MTEKKKLRRLTKVERAVMDFVHEHGGGLDFGGKDAIGSHRQAAERMRLEGLLTGSSYRHITGFSEEGWRVYQRIVRKERRDDFRAFQEEADKWTLGSVISGKSRKRGSSISDTRHTTSGARALDR